MKYYPAFLIGISVTFCYSSCMYLFSALLLTWENELSISRNNLTFIYSLGLVLHSLLLPILGKFVDKNLSFPMMWVSPILLGLSVIYLSLANTYTEFLVAWLLVSATSGGCLYTMLFSVITINLKSKAKTSIAIITLFAGFASTYTFPTATYLTEQYDWRFTVLIFGLLNILISSPANYFGFKSIIRKEFKIIKKQTYQNSNLQIILKDNRFWLFSFSLFVVGFNAGAITTHVIPMLQDKGLSLALAVLTASMFGPGQVLGRILVMIFGGNKANLKLFVICFYSLILGTIFLYFINVNHYLAFLFVLFNGSAYGSMAILKPLVQNDTFGQKNFGNVHGILALLYMIGSISGPWIGSLIWNVGGYDLLIFIFFILAIFGNVTAIFLNKKKFI